MYTILLTLIILASVLMCLVVIIQESKGGGLAADYASGNTLLGAPKTTNIIQKITIILAATMIVLSIASTAFLPGTSSSTSVLDMEDPATAVAPTMPSAPATETADPTPIPAE